MIVSAWGSLGAREMNKVIADVFRLEQQAGCPYQHIHATGSYGWRWMPDYVKQRGVDLAGCPGLEMVEYIYDMPTWMAAADLVIGRAGASTLNEIAASGTPCIIVPLAQRDGSSPGEERPGPGRPGSGPGDPGIRLYGPGAVRRDSGFAGRPRPAPGHAPGAAGPGGGGFGRADLPHHITAGGAELTHPGRTFCIGWAKPILRRKEQANGIDCCGGGRPLEGRIAVSGAKNSVLPLLAAAILFQNGCLLHNCPRLSDVEASVEILEHLGCRVDRGGHSIWVDARGLCREEIPKALMERMRSSILFLGPLLARTGRCTLYEPGGCCLGVRPIDLHLKGLEALGAQFTWDRDRLICRGSSAGRR